MKILMSSWRSRIKTQKKVNKITSVAAQIFSSCSSAGDSFTRALGLQEHFQPIPDPDQRLHGATRPTQPVDDEQQPARALPQYCSAHDHIKLCPQDICSSDLLHYREPVEVPSSEESLYIKVDTSISTELYEMDLLAYQYTLRNALLSIGTLGGELLGQLQASDQMENNENSSFLDYTFAAEDENAENQHFHKLINKEDPDAHEKKLGNGYHDLNSNNALALCMNNGMQYLLKDSTLDSFLKGLCMLGEVGQQQDFGDDRASMCTHRGADQRMMDPFCYYKSVDNILDLSENVQSSIMGSFCTRSSREETVSSSGNAQQRILGSPGLHPLGMIRSSYNSCEDYMLGSFMGASPAQEILDLSKNTHEEMVGSPTSIEGSSSSPASCAPVVNYTLPKGSRVEDNVKEEDNYDPSEGSAHKSNCLKLASTCNHNMDLKRLIVSLTPNCVAKRLLKRFKLVHRHAQTDQAGTAPLMNCNYQSKLSKQFMRMLGMNQNRIPSKVIVKRELRPLAVDYDDMLQRRQAEENWIRTDHEYVVLELEGNIQ